MNKIVYYITFFVWPRRLRTWLRAHPKFTLGYMVLGWIVNIALMTSPRYWEWSMKQGVRFNTWIYKKVGLFPKEEVIEHASADGMDADNWLRSR